MTNEQILLEIERRIKHWFQAGNGGWAEENAGLRLVEETINDLRANSTSPEWD